MWFRSTDPFSIVRKKFKRLSISNGPKRHLWHWKGSKEAKATQNHRTSSSTGSVVVVASELRRETKRRMKLTAEIWSEITQPIKLKKRTPDLVGSWRKGPDMSLVEGYTLSMMSNATSSSSIHHVKPETSKLESYTCHVMVFFSKFSEVCQSLIKNGITPQYVV